MPVPAPGKTEQLREPVEDVQLELGRHGRRPPEEGDLVERSRYQLRENRRLRAGDTEVGEVARVLPVRNAGQEDLVEIAQDVRERLSALGRRWRESRADVTRLHLREHRILADTLEVACDPLAHSRRIAPEVAHRLRSFRTSAQGRALTTFAALSHPRRACATARSR